MELAPQLAARSVAQKDNVIAGVVFKSPKALSFDSSTKRDPD